MHENVAKLTLNNLTFIYQAVWPDLVKFRNFGNFWETLGILKGLFSIWQKFVPNLLIFLSNWANILCC